MVNSLTCILKAKAINKAFPGVQALKNVDFELKKGEIHGLVGENGAGKSTLAKIIAGVYKKDSGKIYFKGESFEPNNILYCLKKGIGIIYQESCLISSLQVDENILLNRMSEFSKFGIINDKKLSLQASVYLEKIDVQINLREKLDNLSIGQQKLIELARVISFNPEVLIIDETLATLDAVESNKLFNFLNKYKLDGGSVIYISHNLSEIFQLCDVVTILKDGSKVATKLVCETNKKELSNLMVGREIGSYYNRTKDKLAISNNNNDFLCLYIKQMSSYSLNNNISFKVPKGKIFGIGGLENSGKEKIANILFGLDSCDCEIYLEKQKISINSPQDAVAHGIGYVPRNRDEEGLALLLSVQRNLILANLDKYLLNNFIIKWKKINEITNKYIELLNIKTRNKDTLCLNLSGGNRQKVVIAKWLICGLKVLILNNPTRGVDVGAKAEIYKLINHLVNDGMTIILISDELPELINMSDEFIIMRKGEISKKFSKENNPTEEEVIKYII